jgi:hypothetical protein
VQQWCYTSVVPTAHPRIALTRDPELDRALRVGASVLGPSKPTASVARELIMRGAQDLLAHAGEELDQWLTGRGATPATRSTSELLKSAAALGPHDPGNPRPLSDALAEMRAEDDR